MANNSRVLRHVCNPYASCCPGMLQAVTALHARHAAWYLAAHMQLNMGEAGARGVRQALVATGAAVDGDGVMPHGGP